MGGPPITITCDCGNRERVRYGDRWTCDECGRTWNTAQIPREEYEGLTRSVRRYHIRVLAFLVVMIAVFLPLVLLVNIGLILPAFVLAFAWVTLYMPRMRRNARRLAAEAPKWKLRPE